MHFLLDSSSNGGLKHGSSRRDFSTPLSKAEGEMGATNPAASLQPEVGENAERQWEWGMLHGKQEQSRKVRNRRS
ncbi:hypothetical protein EK904_005339 [Melospiza melodia maxima]|nr:hypothetical protein EK904_005339 [Melospiza melodia maxima]